MLFSSPVFLFLFMPLLLLCYWSVPRSLRNAVLLVASIVFYVWGERFFFVVMLASIAANWLLGLALDALDAPRQRKAVVAGAVVLNIGLLAFFKYSEFLIANLNDLLAAIGVAPVTVVSPHLPLGISFFTFHALSYVIDVYRGVATAQRRPVDFALYIAFFPQLIAGPIIRYHDIYQQLTRRTVTLELCASGIERFLAGFGKKMLLANPLGEVADKIFALPVAELSPGAAWLGVICYTLQIYLDFSAYSDMAIGLARIFGFHFLENFNYPYLSRSIQEFWRRWHISLSNWLRDYLYIPLGGSRVANWRIYSQSARGVLHLRAVARRQLDLRGLGHDPWRLPDPGTDRPGAAAGPACRGRWVTSIRSPWCRWPGCSSAPPTCTRRCCTFRRCSAAVAARRRWMRCAMSIRW